MRIYTILGIIFFLGPTSNHRVLCQAYDDEGSGDGVDFFWPEDHDATEGSASRGPYNADYDYVPDDTEADEDDTFDPYNYEEVYSGDCKPSDEDCDVITFDPEDEIIVETKHENEAVPEYKEPEDREEEVGGGDITVEEEPPKDTLDVVTDYTETEDREDPFVVDSPVVTSASVPTSTERTGMEGGGVVIQSKNEAERPVSVFTQPGILAAFIGGAVVGLLCAILLVMFIVYRMRKKDEGSYPLDEPKRMPLTSSYSPNDKEIYA